MNLREKISEQLNWSDPTYRIPFILFMFICSILVVIFLCFLPTQCQEEEKLTVFIYCFSAMEPVLEEAILPAFTSHWHEETGDEVEFIVCYSGSGLITNRVISRFKAQIVILASEIDAYQLSQKKIINQNAWQDLPYGGKLCYSPLILYSKTDFSITQPLFQELDFENQKIAISSPLVSGAGQWALLGLYGSILRDGTNEMESLEYLSDVYEGLIYSSSNAQMAFEGFMKSDVDMLISYEAFGSGKGYGNTEMPISIYPHRTIAAEPVVIPVNRNIWLDEEEIIDTFLQFLWSKEAQILLTDYGFRVYDQTISINEQRVGIQDMFFADSLDDPETLLNEIITPLSRLKLQ